MTQEIERFELRTRVEKWPLKAPFRIAGYSWDHHAALWVGVYRNGHLGQGEAAGVYYKSETADSMAQQLESLRDELEAGVSRDELQRMLPAGGARNALDCALWDLEAQIERRPAWEIAGMKKPKPLVTTFTCGADEPDKMAAAAIAYKGARAIKLKLLGDMSDLDRVRVVREARGDVWLAIDANQAFTPPLFRKLLPILLDSRVSLVEQPFPVGEEALVDEFRKHIPIAADESVQTLGDLDKVAEHFDIVNIKLDKCGGLTEGLAMARTARQMGLELMVGNMTGTSLAMAPAYLLGQMCKIVDLDGPVFLTQDRTFRAQYSDGFISFPDAAWGAASS